MSVVYNCNVHILILHTCVYIWCGMKALLAPLGGILESENCIRAHIAAAEKRGATVRCGTKVTSWSAAEDGLLTVTDITGMQHYAKRMVLCVGAWSGHLVPELQGYLQAQRQVVAWFEVKNLSCALFVLLHRHYTCLARLCNAVGAEHFQC